MFKKEKSSAEKSKFLLKNKEIRTLRSEIIKQFPSVTEEQISSFIPNKAQVFQTKLLNKTIIYSVENIPFAFDLNGRNNLYPTLQLLWHIPNMLMSFVIHGPVSEFIMNGADLMAPGICTLEGLEGLQVGSKTCIKIVGNPLPFAVGESLMDYSALSGPGRRKGKAMTVLHLFGDLVSGSVGPNGGFGQSVIYPVEDVPNYQLERESYCRDEDEEVAAAREQPASSGTTTDNNGAVPEDLEDGFACVQRVTAEGFSSAGGAEAMTSQVAVIDAQLQTALLVALRHVVKDQQLPMLASTFWAVLLRCHAVLSQNSSFEDCGCVELDVRRSSFKKVSVCLAHYARVKLLSLRDQTGVLSIVNVQRAHELFRGAKVDDPEGFKASVAAKASGSAECSDEQAEPASEFAQNILVQHQAAAAATTGSKITVLELYKLPKQLRDVFGSAIRGVYGEYLSAAEIRDVLVAYIKQHSLEAANDKGSVVVGPSLPLFKVLPPNTAAPNTTQTAAGDVACCGQEPSGVSCDSLETSMPPPSCSTVFDPWARPAVTPPLGLRVHKDGLMRITDDFPLAAVSEKPAAAAATEARVKMIAGSSSVGGWGVDKGVEWKPVSLPTAAAVAPAQKSQPDKKKAVVGSADWKRAAVPAAASLSVGQSDVVVRKDVLFKAVLGKASPYCGIIASDGRLSVHSGQVAKAKVLLETRMGNKTVTILRNLEIFGVDISALAKDCQKRFACSVSVSSVPSNPRDKEVVLQGNYGVDIEPYLTSVWGVPRHLVEVEATKGAKLKKKK